MEKPTIIPQTEIDVLPLAHLCASYLNFLESEDYHEGNDYDQYIFEQAMETFYGKKVWDYINSKIK